MCIRDSRTLFTAPSDALVVDLDRNFVLTSDPPTALNNSQRTKFITRLTQALNGDVAPSGVPQHLRSAYGGGKLIPAGQIIVMRGEVESVQDPAWWHQDAVMSVMDHVCDKLGRNTGMKAVFGGAQKKPLMTKISTRHLNEIIRERNQYSRDAMEAWQDFINLKGRMDMELAKVTKRNNFLVEELESWKQQFLKFQAFAEQLTKETQDLKIKIDGHKRENKRLVLLIDQQKDEMSRVQVRLGGTEKQRDDALEALVLQQEIAEELERERKRNKKDMSSLQHTNNTLLRQRDEAQRVVLHLRALIDGQAHHMEHIVRNLSENINMSDVDENSVSPTGDRRLSRTSSRTGSRPSSRLSRRDSEMDNRTVNDAATRRRLSQLGLNDAADRSLRDKTDAIAYIIRNISEQCAAAVEGLHLAQRADTISSNSEETEGARRRSSRGTLRKTTAPSEDGTSSEFSDARSEAYLHPNGHGSSIPPTPDLEQTNSVNRSSTSMSVSSVATPDRHSIQSQWRTIDEDIPEVPARLSKPNDAGVVGDFGSEQQVEEPITKYRTEGLEDRRGLGTQK